jgi:hypothetical protein
LLSSQYKDLLQSTAKRPALQGRWPIAAVPLGASTDELKL